MNVDFEAMVVDGLIELDIMADTCGTKWSHDYVIDYYKTACLEGDQAVRDELREVVLQTTTAYGVQLFRWADFGPDGTEIDHGPPTMSPTEAVIGGEKRIAEMHDPCVHLRFAKN